MTRRMSRGALRRVPLALVLAADGRFLLPLALAALAPSLLLALRNAPSIHYVRTRVRLERSRPARSGEQHGGVRPRRGARRARWGSGSGPPSVRAVLAARPSRPLEASAAPSCKIHRYARVGLRPGDGRRARARALNPDSEPSMSRLEPQTSDSKSTPRAYKQFRKYKLMNVNTSK